MASNTNRGRLLAAEMRLLSLQTATNKANQLRLRNAEKRAAALGINVRAPAAKPDYSYSTLAARIARETRLAAAATFAKPKDYSSQQLLALAARRAARAGRPSRGMSNMFGMPNAMANMPGWIQGRLRAMATPGESPFDTIQRCGMLGRVFC